MINVIVFRMFGHELEQPVNDMEVALQLHNLRGQTLHEVFDNQDKVKVVKWGDTDKPEPHEWIELLLDPNTIELAGHVLIPAAKFIFEKIADKALEAVVEKTVSWVLSKLKKKQQENKIGRIEIRLPNGVVLFANKPEFGGKIRFTVNGQWEEIEL